MRRCLAIRGMGHWRGLSEWVEGVGKDRESETRAYGKSQTSGESDVDLIPKV